MLRDYDPAWVHPVGTLDLRFQSTVHDVPCWPVSLPGSGRLVHSGDTGPSGELATFASGADLFLCEATYPTGGGSATSHLTGRLAGEIAHKANVRQLILTHFWPSYDREQIAREAEVAFGRAVRIAEPGRRFRLSSVD